MRILQLSILTTTLCCLATGCGSGTQSDPPAPASENHAHSHGDELYWQKENIEHEGMTISLGHHGKNLYGHHNTEPAVMIVRDGEAVADAKVYVTMFSVDDDEAIGDEKSTEFEPKTKDEPAHYAQATFEVPDVEGIGLRYRIEFEGEIPEFSEDVKIKVEKHD